MSSESAFAGPVSSFPFPDGAGQSHFDQRLRPQCELFSHSQKIPSRHQVPNSHGRDSKEHICPYSRDYVTSQVTPPRPSNYSSSKEMRYCKAHRRIHRPSQATTQPEWSIPISRLTMRAWVALHPCCRPKLIGARESPSRV